MANEFEKIFSDAPNDVSDNISELDAGDVIKNEDFVNQDSEQPKASAREKYLKDIFEIDSDETTDFEKNFDEKATYSKNEEGFFEKQENDFSDTDEQEDEEKEEESLDEADEIADEIENNGKKSKRVSKKKKNTKKQPTKTASKEVFKQEEYETHPISTDEEKNGDIAFLSPDVPVKSDLDAQDNEILDENDVSSVRKKSVLKNKSVSELSSDEMAALTPDEIQNLSPEEINELLQMTDEKKSLNEQAIISGIKNADEIRDNNVIDIKKKDDINNDVSERLNTHSINSDLEAQEIRRSESAYYEPVLEPQKTKADEIITASVESVSSDNNSENDILPKDTLVNNASAHNLLSDDILEGSILINNSPINRTLAENIPESGILAKDASVKGASTDNNFKNDVFDASKNSAPNVSVSDVSKADASLIDVERYNNYDSILENKEFSVSDFEYTLKKYTGYDVNVRENKNTFEIYTPSESFVLDKKLGNISESSGAFGAIIEKAYEQYDRNTVFQRARTANKPKDESVLVPPIRQDSWSAEKVASGLKNKYGDVTFDKNNTNDNPILCFPAQNNASSFSVELDKTHSPIKIDNPPPFINEVIEDIFRQTQEIKTADNAEYIRQTTLYNDSINTKGKDDRAFISFEYPPEGFNPNGSTKKIGDGFNISDNFIGVKGNHSVYLQRKDTFNPYLSNKLSQSAISNRITIYEKLNKPIITAPEYAQICVKNLYNNFVDFREKLRKNNVRNNVGENEYYSDKTFSEEKTVYLKSNNDGETPLVPFKTVLKETDNVTETVVKLPGKEYKTPYPAQSIQTYGSAVASSYNLNTFSPYNFVSEAQSIVNRAAHSLTHPLINVVRSTASSTEIGQGAHQISGFLGAPVLVGAYAAYQNIWQIKDKQGILNVVSDDTFKVVKCKLNNAGVSFIRSKAYTVKDYNYILSSLNNSGRSVGLYNVNKLSYSELKKLQNSIKSKTITLNGKVIDYASAKSIYRHLGQKANSEIIEWMKKSSVIEAALSVQTTYDGLSQWIIKQFKGLNLIKPNDTFNLMNARDIFILRKKLSLYATDNGFENITRMSGKKLLDYIRNSKDENGLLIANLFQALKQLEKKANVMSQLKFSRLFSVIQLVQSVLGRDNDIVQGGFMIFRTTRSAIMAIKATLRFTKTSVRFLQSTGRRVKRLAQSAHLDVPAKAIKKVFRGTVIEPIKYSRVGSVVTKSASSIKSTTLAQRLIDSRKKFAANAAQRKAKAINFALGKSKIGTAIKNFEPIKAISGAFKKAGAAVGKALGIIVVAIAIFLGIVCAISFVGEIAINAIDTLSAFTEKDTEKQLQELYDDLSKQDETFYDEITESGLSSNKNQINGFYDLNSFNGSSKTFNMNKIQKPGDETAPDGSLNKTGYEYHLYDRLLDGTKSPADAGAKEIPFESNAKQIISLANTVFLTDTNKKTVLINGRQVKYDKALKDYCIDGSYFNDINLWTATHGKFTVPSDKYSCQNGCASYSYFCNKYKAQTDKNSDYLNVSSTANAENQAFYSLFNSRNTNLKVFGSPVTQTEYGCKVHDKNRLSAYPGDKITYKYYCGLSHLSNDGKCYICSAANSSHYGIGHTLDVKKIQSCNEQKLVYEDKTMTFTEETKDNKKATYSNFTSAYNTYKASLTNNTIKNNLYCIEQTLSGTPDVKLRGWVYMTFSASDSNLQTIRRYINNNVCNAYKEQFIKKTIWLGPVTPVTLYCYFFYCPGHSTCEHSINASDYQKKTCNFSFSVTDNENKVYEFSFNGLKLAYQCNAVKGTSKQVSVKIPHFECVGYCDGNHNINYCKGHYNNIVNAYIVTSMDNSFDFVCENPECSKYGVLQTGVSDNTCSGTIEGLFGETTCGQLGKMTNLKPTSIFYADLAFGPSSVGNMPHWGTKNYANPNDFSELGWYSNKKGAGRMSLACVKNNADWYYFYGIEQSSTITSTSASYSEIKSFLELSQTDTAPEGESSADRESRLTRKEILSVALNSTGKIPYYDTGTARGTDYSANNFGAHTSIADKRGRTLTGLNNETWVNWVYKTALTHRINDMSGTYKQTFSNINNGIAFGGSIKTSEMNTSLSSVSPGDVLVMRDGRYAIYIGADGSKLCVVEEADEPTNNVTVKYYNKTSFSGFISFSSVKSS